MPTDVGLENASLLLIDAVAFAGVADGVATATFIIRGAEGDAFVVVASFSISVVSAVDVDAAPICACARFGAQFAIAVIMDPAHHAPAPVNVALVHSHPPGPAPCPYPDAFSVRGAEVVAAIIVADLLIWSPGRPGGWPGRPGGWPGRPGGWPGRPGVGPVTVQGWKSVTF